MPIITSYICDGCGFRSEDKIEKFLELIFLAGEPDTIVGVLEDQVSELIVCRNCAKELGLDGEEPVKFRKLFQEWMEMRRTLGSNSDEPAVGIPQKCP